MKQNSGQDPYLRPPSELRSQCYGHTIFDLTQTLVDSKQTPTQTLPPANTLVDWKSINTVIFDNLQMWNCDFGPLLAKRFYF